jgi:hypothetical protein
VRRPSWAGLVAGAIALAVNGIYVAILVVEDEGNQFGFAYVIGAAGLAALAASFVRRPDIRAPLLGGAALILAGIGLLGIFSIGLPLLLAAGFAAAGCRGATHAANGQWMRRS